MYVSIYFFLVFTFVFVSIFTLDEDEPEELDELLLENADSIEIFVKDSSSNNTTTNTKGIVNKALSLG